MLSRTETVKFTMCALAPESKLYLSHQESGYVGMHLPGMWG